MRYCIFCRSPIVKVGDRHHPRLKYCSSKCWQRMWYKARNPHSYSNESPKFWKSNTGIGFRWERYAAKLLNARHIEFNKNGADLDWNGKKVDVKVANPFRRKDIKGASAVWVFNRGKPKAMDFFFCIALEKNAPIKTLLIPSTKFPAKGIVIGKKSKYDMYGLAG